MPELNTHTDLHKQLIESVLAQHPGAKTTGFGKATKALWLELGGDGDDWLAPRFVPDAYQIDRDNQDVTIFEVSVTHGLTDEKLTELANWWFHWDSEGQHDWLPKLIEIDRFGQSREIDLSAMYRALCLVPKLYRKGPLSGVQGARCT